MTAIEPWSGHFDINGPVYISGINGPVYISGINGPVYISGIVC